ncbi:Kiwa anti-phage protein KwaB-like domain-containing protein [Geothrix sp. 21YS21S-4]|uniref:Kiwa anti-phage protein KwaB-like domain-containing protein n=1 Tax=Geothrix sp. 21YS21S-4 TaxID=3068889 RepID=UPI0027B95CD0|nr:Kiwa anti-phage protein KwaB-like domain-containing protein [Geothrix sp. 21YS21S-4]
MPSFNEWKNFNYTQSTVQLWVFKKSSTDAKYKGWHVRTDGGIEVMFRNAVINQLSKISEHFEYTHISQNNESSCMEHPLEDCEGLIALLDIVDQPEGEHVAENVKQLRGSTGYLVKFQFNDETVYAVKKTAPSWSPKIRKSLINALFIQGELSVVPNEEFTFSSFFDFFCFNENVYIIGKRSFESTIAEKSVYKKNFSDLRLSPEFISVFSEMTSIVEFVGENAMHLRRMATIQKKEVYRNPNFLIELKRVSDMRNWGIEFDAEGRIVPTLSTAKIIIQVLLDHRLFSEITSNYYDVPDAIVV